MRPYIIFASLLSCLFVLHGSAAAQNGKQKTAPVDIATRGYVASLVSKIRYQTVYPGNPASIPGNPEAIFRIEQLPDGDITSVTLIESSGVPDFDKAVEKGIYKSSPLPKKTDGTVVRVFDAHVFMK